MFYCVHDTCDGETKVLRLDGTQRRRKCLLCSTTFYTNEVQIPKPKRGGARPNAGRPKLTEVNRDPT